MFRVGMVQLWVHDQDEAIAFWTQKVGMELRADVTVPEMGDFRWVTVGPPGQDQIEIVLMSVMPELFPDEETRQAMDTLMARGVQTTIFLVTDDCRRDYAELSARGVEFSQEPEERPYGIDTGFRDPFGNAVRLTQLRSPAPA